MSTWYCSLASCHKLRHNIIAQHFRAGWLHPRSGGIEEPSKQMIHLIVSLWEGAGSGRLLKVQLFRRFSLVAEDVRQNFIERQKKFDACPYDYR